MSGEIVVSENGKGRYQQSVSIGEHALIADEPLQSGGNDAGPAPFDFVMAGLGACTSMTLRMYAERKAIPLKQVRVSLTHDHIEVDGIRRDRLHRNIQLDGDLSAAQRQRLLEIANKCPVHRAISQPFLIETKLSDQAAPKTSSVEAIERLC